MQEAHLANFNKVFIEKAGWIMAVSSLALLGLIMVFDSSVLALTLGASIGLFTGMVCPLLWQKDLQFLNLLLVNFLFILPSVYLMNSTEQVHVAFQFILTVITVSTLCWFVFKSKLIAFLKIKNKANR
ncbi:hypothetical protein C1E24_18285 [Pseudoalteromonas phenolica]|uniref:Uncharacterized protein n=1 Tax=Pseudoalteromonas phenolica TaxID=161398 RepID=A0A5R9PX91_9GAMM|nr:hypothetical protein [Pseudoalteromonas phenolica]TLX45540.1 hypothetical protein C1E24_18285 [Pseudoalteromonas phenolica]